MSGVISQTNKQKIQFLSFSQNFHQLENLIFPLGYTVTS